MKEFFNNMLLLDNYTKPKDKFEVFLYVVLYIFWIPIFLVATFAVFPLWILLIPFKLLYRKFEEDAINEYIGKW